MGAGRAAGLKRPRRPAWSTACAPLPPRQPAAQPHARTPSFSRVLLVPWTMRPRSCAAFSLNTRASLPSTLDAPLVAACARTWGERSGARAAVGLVCKRHSTAAGTHGSEHPAAESSPAGPAAAAACRQPLPPSAAGPPGAQRPPAAPCPRVAVRMPVLQRPPWLLQSVRKHGSVGRGAAGGRGALRQHETGARCARSKCKLSQAPLSVPTSSANRARISWGPTSTIAAVTRAPSIDPPPRCIIHRQSRQPGRARRRRCHPLVGAAATTLCRASRGPMVVAGPIVIRKRASMGAT